MRPAVPESSPALRIASVISRSVAPRGPPNMATGGCFSKTRPSIVNSESSCDASFTAGGFASSAAAVGGRYATARIAATIKYAITYTMLVKELVAWLVSWGLLCRQN